MRLLERVKKEIQQEGKSETLDQMLEDLKSELKKP
jgi:hypothetical protein